MILHGDCMALLATFEAESIDACVTDPPYGLSFMAKDWDVPGGIGGFPMRRRAEVDATNTGASRQGGRQRSCVDFQRRQQRDAEAFEADTRAWAAAVYRVLKPGAHLVACAGTRMYHRLACGIEDAGFEIRDCFAWLYASGFPKSLNLGEGLGTALKPAHEPIVLARKPTRGTVKANVERYGTGALNIDVCRIDTDDNLNGGAYSPGVRPNDWTGDDAKRNAGVFKGGAERRLAGQYEQPEGRWPANVCLDEHAAMVLDEQMPNAGSWTGRPEANDGTVHRGSAFFGNKPTQSSSLVDDSMGGASRFFYVAKPSREERDYGCMRNHHPTVKPVELMRWLVRLVTPPNGVVLDPFMGSGTTGMACRYELRRFIGIEREAEYIAIAERRIAATTPLFGEVG